MILTQEQILKLDIAGCQRALKRLAREHRLDTPWSQLTKEERDQCDIVGNTLLGLEDRIRNIQNSQQAQQANEIRWANHIPEPKTAKPPKEPVKPRRKKFRIGDKIYLDVQTAAAETGLKIDTLRAYVGRKNDVYGYVD